MSGLNSTSDIEIANQARQCSFKAVVDDERPLKWSDTEVFIGLVLNVPNITNIDAHCSTCDIIGDTESFDLLFPEGMSKNVRKWKEYGGRYGVRGQIYKQLNRQLRSLTYEAVDDLLLPLERYSLGLALQQHCSSLTDVEVIISDVSINSSELSCCMQACRHLKSLYSFRVRLLDVDPTLLSADRRVDDDDPLTYAAALQCASVFKEFLLQHAKTLETCVLDSIVSTSEHQPSIFAGGLRGFSATGKNAKICFRTYTCKPPATKEENTGDLRALRVVMETE